MSGTRRSRIVPEVDFERDGRQHGFLRLFHSTHASAYGFIPIPIVVIRNGDGPTALFVSGNHGDEYEGQVAICNLAKSLQPDAIKGRVILLPAANFPAAMAGRRVSPIDDGNLNRSFPGDPDGTMTKQIAFYIEHALIPLADIVCDLHSGGSSLMYVPSALVRRSADPERDRKLLAALRAFGAPHNYTAPPAREASGTGGDATSTGASERNNVIIVGTELGGSGTVTPAALAIAERGLRNILAHVGILPVSAPAAPAGNAAPVRGGRPRLLRLRAGERGVRAAGRAGPGGKRGAARRAHPLPRDALDAAGRDALLPRRNRAVQARSRPHRPRRLPVPSRDGNRLVSRCPATGAAPPRRSRRCRGAEFGSSSNGSGSGSRAHS